MGAGHSMASDPAVCAVYCQTLVSFPPRGALLALLSRCSHLLLLAQCCHHSHLASLHTSHSFCCCCCGTLCCFVLWRAAACRCWPLPEGAEAVSAAGGS